MKGRKPGDFSGAAGLAEKRCARSGLVVAGATISKTNPQNLNCWAPKTNDTDHTTSTLFTFEFGLLAVH